MFKKLLVANRGEVAVRVVRACRDMGIRTVAVYTAVERDSLHVRLADECIELKSEQRYSDAAEILEIAQMTGADAIHPGYGFLAEHAEFAQACADAGIAFIGPPPSVIAEAQNKLDTMEKVRSLGYGVPNHSEASAGQDDEELLAAMADEVGYPLVVKSCSGGRGRGSRVVYARDKLAEMVAIARREALKVYGSDRLYLEKAISPSHYVVVQILADDQGNLVHLGEREGSLLLHNQKLVEESPAPCLTQERREQLWEAALDIARHFNYRGVGAVEFLVDGEGNFYFTELKARIQIEHPVSELVSGVDMVREQIHIAAGEPLRMSQAEIRLRGWAMQCRINAEDPWNNFMPSPGQLTRFRLPGGPHVRVDTYGYAGCHIPVRFDPLLANAAVWGEDREDCVRRMRRALEDFNIIGVQTNLPMHLQILSHPDFVSGRYDTNFMRRLKFHDEALDDITRRDLAVAAAVAFVLRNQMGRVAMPDRLQSGWHRSSRRMPS